MNMFVRLLSISPSKTHGKPARSCLKDLALGLSEETSQEGDQFDADQDDAATSHELFDALAFGARIIVPVAFQ